jgi:hypothetical protein
MNINLRQLSIEEGFNNSYFSAMRNTNRSKFERVFGFDENKKVSLEKYKKYVEYLKCDVEEIYYYLKDNKKIKDFVENHTSYKTVQDFDRALFSVTENTIKLYYSKVLKWEEIKESFDLFSFGEVA